MLAKHCLQEFKLDCQLRRLTERTIKGYYNNTLNFLNYAEKHHEVVEVEEIRTVHIKHYVQYLLNKKLAATYINGILKCLRAYKLIINDGYYYVLAWNAQRGSTITFRLDRMKGVEILNEPREGNMEFSKINMEAYTQQHFGMFSGDKKRVSLRFTNNLLDTMVDRFGTGADVSYYADGERHFVVNAEIAISDQFYGWLCGFRKMAKIVSPPDVVEDFQNFLDDIYGRYEAD